MRLFTARLLNCREISIARIYANGYTSGASAPAPTPTPAKKSNEDLATEVIRGLWGNGQERKSHLEAAGYNYYAVRQIVNDRLALARRDTAEYYIVKPGDTLWAIAQRYGTTYQEIARLSGILNPSLIFPGQKVRVK